MSVDQPRQIISRSTISFEHPANVSHADVVALLRKAIINKDVEALLNLNKIVADVRGV